MAKSNKKIWAGLIVMAAMLSVSVSYSTAFAQESDLEAEAVERLVHPKTILAGTGAAVSEDDQGWRSHFRMGIVSEPQTSDSNSDTEYTVKRGVFTVGKQDNRHFYSVIPETWEILVRSDKENFEASGTVENKEGKTYDVKIEGEKISDLQNGNLYYVLGTAINEDGDVYELFYISPLVERNHSIQPTIRGTQ